MGTVYFIKSLFLDGYIMVVEKVDCIFPSFSFSFSFTIKVLMLKKPSLIFYNCGFSSSCFHSYFKGNGDPLHLSPFDSNSKLATYINL